MKKVIGREVNGFVEFICPKCKFMNSYSTEVKIGAGVFNMKITDAYCRECGKGCKIIYQD